MIAADGLPANSMVIPKKMLMMKMTPKDALDALDLVRAGALHDHPFSANKWVKYTMLLWTTRMAEIKKEKTFSLSLFGKNFNPPFTKAKEETMALSIDEAFALLFENKRPEEKEACIEM